MGHGFSDMGMITKLLTALFLWLAVSAFGANPDYKSFRGIGGITLTTNPPNGLIIIDGSSIESPTGGVSAATATNISQYFVTNSMGKPLFGLQYNSNGVLQGNSALIYSNNTVTVAGRVNVATNGYYSYDGLDVLWGDSVKQNWYFGYQAGKAGATGIKNTGIGFGALNQISSGSYNTAVGENAMVSNTSGGQNTAVGRVALNANTVGTGNTAIGYGTLELNVNGINNTAVGAGSLNQLVSGTYNLGVGIEALNYLQNGNYNTAVGGYDAMLHRLTGDYNTSLGTHSMYSNTNGNHNTSIGSQSFIAQFTGDDNVALGYTAGNTHLTGSSNIVIGSTAQLPTTNSSQKMNIGNLLYGDMATGRIGINTNLPQVPLHIFVATGGGSSPSPFGGETLVIENSGNNYINLISGTSGNGGLLFSDNVGGRGYILYSHASDIMQFVVGGQGGLNLASSGFAGIGTSIPSSALDVVGQVRAASAIFTNSISTEGTITASQLNAQIIKASGSAGLANVYATNFIYAPTNTGPVAVTTNLFASGTRYTNDNRRAFVTASVQLSAAAAGTAKMTLYVENAGSATNRASVSAGPLASLITVEQLMLPVGPSMIYYFTDETSGVGATASIVANTCSIIGF